MSLDRIEKHMIDPSVFEEFSTVANVDGLNREVAYLKLKSQAEDRLEGGTVFAHDMNGNIIGMTLDEANSQNIIIRDGKMMMIAKSEVQKTVTDSTVIAGMYDTGGNGGRKLVRLNTGRLIITIKSSTERLLYRSDDNGISWALMSSATVASSDSALATNGVYFYNIYAKGTTQIEYTGLVKGKRDGGTIETGQTVIGNVSLTINPEGTELHATWSSKNATYPNSFNIRYAKGIISQVDGSVTWGTVEQVSKWNTASNYVQNPSIVVNGQGKPIIISEGFDGVGYYIMNFYQNGALWSFGDIVPISSYPKSNPSAIFVPKSVNGLANGRIWVAWHGTDATVTTFDGLRVSYSDDNGATWSTMQKIYGSASSAGHTPSITANKHNVVNIVFVDTYNGGVRVIKNVNGNWGISTPVSSNGYAASPSTLVDFTIDFSEPLLVYKTNSKVGFYGTWKEPVETPSLTATAIYNVPTTDYVGLYLKNNFLHEFPVLYVNDVKMDMDMNTPVSELKFTKELDVVAPVKLRIELSRAAVGNQHISRILGGRS